MVQVVRRLIIRVLLLWWSLFTPQGVVGWLFGFAIMGFLIPVYQASLPPAHMLSATEDDGVAVVGGEMIVRYHNLKNRYCKNSVTRWLVAVDFKVSDEPTPLWVALGSSASPPVALGDQRYAISLHIPSDVLPGVYHYIATTDYDCGLLSWFSPPTVRSPDMIVNLVQRAPGSPVEPVVVPNGDVRIGQTLER